MKIVSVLTSSERGGAEFAAVWLLDALATHGHETTLLTNLTGLCDETGVRELPIEIGPKLSRSSYGKLALSGPKLALALRRSLRRVLPYDLLLLHFKKEQLLTLGLPREIRAACIWAEWGPLPKQLRSGPANLIFRLAARRAACVFAVSVGTRDTLVSAGLQDDRVFVLPNAVRIEEHRFDEAGGRTIRAQLGIGEDAFVVGSMTRLHAKKRNDVLVRAIELLEDDTHLILAGDGDRKADLERLAEPLGERVHFLRTPGRDAARVISAFDLAVFSPSPTEGAPLSVIIPMLCGRPVVATGAEGASGLIAPGTGLILEPEHDAAALAQGIAAYRDDRARLQREGEAAREHATRTHSADAVATEFERVVRTAIEEGRGA